MPIPQFDHHGLLPEGIWDCTLDEIELIFCMNAHRQDIFDGLKRFLNTEWLPHGIEASILIDGSFVRNKQFPADVDIVIDISSSNDPQVLSLAMALRLRHSELKRNYNVDLWVKHPLIPNDLVAFFQYVGVKAAAELSLVPTDPKGILRIQP